MNNHFISIPKNQWDDEHCTGFSEQEVLLYRSKLLGSDLTITNYGGGNTSAKISEKNPLNDEFNTLLWVKRSGCDLRTMKMDDFVVLYQDKIEELKSVYRGLEFESEMVGLLQYCFQKAGFQAPSIETFTHAYIPYKHVDHLHSDSIISIATSSNGKTITREIYGDEIGWIPWQRPGFDFALNLEEFILTNPNMKGVIWQHHGLITWGQNSKDCYFNSVNTITKAAIYINNRAKSNAFGKLIFTFSPSEKRKNIACKIMPRLRYYLSKQNRKMGQFFDSEDILEFVNAENASEFCDLGTSCPDHFLRTKIKPLYFKTDLDQLIADETLSRLEKEIDDYAKSYSDYYKKNKEFDSPNLRDPFPVIILIPGLGLFAFGKNKRETRISAEFYINAIHVMKGAICIDNYTVLSEKEAFDVEYWSLEEDKLKRLPKEKEMARKIALIVNQNNPGIVHKMLSEDACITDIESSSSLIEEFKTEYFLGLYKTKTNKTEFEKAMVECTLNFGGIDVFVLDKTVFYTESKLSDIAHKIIKKLKYQGLGGSIILINPDFIPKAKLDLSTENEFYALAKKLKKIDVRLNMVTINKNRSKTNIDISDAVFFLASELSVNCTGSKIYIN